MNCYWADTINEFFTLTSNEILGNICRNDPHTETNILQRNTWSQEIAILKDQLSQIRNIDSGARILFEYTIPRMGRRVDVVLLCKNIVFLLEFKCGDTEYKNDTREQVYGYALDLKDFQKESKDKVIVPIMISTKAQACSNRVLFADGVFEPLRCNSKNIFEAIYFIIGKVSPQPSFDYLKWENSEYLPTPSIIEASIGLYNNMKVEEITRSDADAINLAVTSKVLDEIIDRSKITHRKSICFVTGVPGAGKTLVGLNVAIKHSHSNTNKGGTEPAVFLSGNQPLVSVLQEALARDKVSQSKLAGKSISKAAALRETTSFIQIIHRYRDSFVGNNNKPPEHVAIFDEAQRAWTKDQISKFMATKKGIPNFSYSEPEFLISTMDRHDDWAVIICLVGGGQEINTGEAGLPEWFEALKRSFKNWDVYLSPNLKDTEYLRMNEYGELGRERMLSMCDRIWDNMILGLHVLFNASLHLNTSVRSYRTPDLAAFVKAVLDVDRENAKILYQKIKDKYPILLTRDLNEAKTWVRKKCKGPRRYGLIASSGGLRLTPEGIYVKNDVSVENWFLNDRDDVRSSYFLENVITEFDIQGLEVDYAIVAWDADFRFDKGQWTYNRFWGNTWQQIASEEDRRYLKNAYRVLLTRSRQGMAIFIPEGNDQDHSRKKELYDGTYNFLKSVMSD